MTSHPHTAPRAVFLTAILAVFVACTQPDGVYPPGTMSDTGPADGGDVGQTLDLKARGLYVTDNPMEPPPGTLLRADNAVITRQGIIEVRRGNKPDAALTSAADSLTEFISGTTTIIGHTGGNKLFRRTSETTSSDYTGTYEPASDYRMRFAEENNNLYALTSAGVYRLSIPTGTWGAAGAPPALEGTGSLSGSSGFLDGQNAGGTYPGLASVAYRFIWGNRDGNGNLHFGTPSGRLVVTNNNLTGRDVAIVERLPSGISAGTDFLQVYRTAIRPHTVALAASSPIVRATRDGSNVATVTTSSAHGFASGDVVLMPAFTAGSFTGGLKTLTGVTSTTFTYADTGSSYSSASGSVSNAARTSDVTTITTAAAHGFVVGDVVNMPTVTVGTAIFSGGLKTLATVPSTTTFTYSDSGPDVAAGASSAGTVYVASVGTVYNSTRTVEDPGEEMALIAELFPTSADVTAGTISYTDVATTENGPSAYFSPSQGGLVTSREVPPVAKDIATFKGYDFYAVTAARQRLKISLLAVGGTSGLQLTEGLLLEHGDTSVGFAAAATENMAAYTFQLYTSGTAAQNIENTARSLVRVINGTNNGIAYATYASGENDAPGSIVLFARDASATAFTVKSLKSLNPIWAPNLTPYSVFSSVTRAGNVVTATMATTAGLDVGTSLSVFLSWSNSTDEANFPTATVTVASIPDATHITFANAGVNATSLDELPFEVVQDTVTTSDGVASNTYARSDYNDAESVPIYNYSQVGSSSATLLRIIAQGDSLWFFTSEGLYRMTGTDETDFTIRPFDMTVHLIAPDSVVAAGNRVWAWTDDGVVSISESGVERISQPIDKVLRELRATFESNSPDMSGELAIRTFALGYESEHEYRLWLPTTTSDAYATQCYVYNFSTGAWTRHTVSARAGIVSHGDDRLYLADTSAQLRRERKARTAADYQDADGVGIAFDVVYAANVAQNPGGTKWWKKGSFLFETTAPASVGVQFATEVNPTYSTGTLTTNGLPYVSTYLPVAVSRSAVLYAGVTHSTAAEKCAITGVQVEYEAVSNVLR